jgi:dipeptidyl aminopeptidase/acylaminoacyl peptidase
VRTLTTRGSTGLSLIDPTTGKSTAIEIPKGATVSSPAWSPDGKQLAYIANFDAASHVYVADVATAKSVQVTKTPLLATLVTTIDWTADGKNIVTVQLPDNRGAEPKKPDIATGPQVRLWLDGVKSPQRQFASLMWEPWEFEQMKYYVTGQLAVIDVKTKLAKKVGAPAMFNSVDASPDGQYFRVNLMQEPFSYVVQYTSFGAVEQLWDANGKMVTELQKRSLREGPDSTQAGAGFAGRGGAAGPPGKRMLGWMPNGTGMFFIAGDSANGGGRAGAPAGRGGRGGPANGAGGARREHLVLWKPPYGAADTATLYQADGPIATVTFTDDGKQAFIGTSANGTGEIYHVDFATPGEKHTIVRQRAYTPAFTAGGAGGRGGVGGGGGASRGAAAADDSLMFYANPGAMMTRRGTLGGQVAMVSTDGAVFLAGTQYHPDYLRNPPRNFVDRVEIKTGAKTRIFNGAADAVETVTAALDDDFSKAIVTRETPKEVADAYLRDMKAGTMTKLTANKDYTPEFTNAIRKRITVTRPDGFHFIVKLTLPADYKAGTRLPAMFWFYPYEYTEQANYDRTLRNENVNAFPNGGPRSIEYLTQLGYAVANFDPPIVGQDGRMNDNYVSDLVTNLSTVIDELDRQGYIDRTRLGIGGHSYGGFSTMNALAHTPFFKAGIAGDGMYNRTLTPTAFQNERRDFWQAQKTYEEMSPFFYADKIQGAVLMYHSIEDQNVGTDPISSIRMMQALRANGKNAALFMYPYEDHGPATKESDLDQWARWVAWLDLYVKNANAKKPTVVP